MAIRISPLLFRRIHKWVGLILGLQFVLWTVSGAVMALINHHEVSGEHLAHGHEAMPWPAQVIPPAQLPASLGGSEVLSFALRPLLHGHVYEVQTPQGIRLVDATSGQAMTVDAELAKAVAAMDHAGEAPVSRVTRVTETTLETREHSGPLWRVDFADDDNSSFYVSEATGKVVERKSDTWRLWDFFWMLHNMDYVERKSFNHPLIIMVAFGVLWLSSTGFYLLFKSFRKTDFRWLGVGGKRATRVAPKSV
jgi:uncharacterized iron-regulated membrane protein